MGTRFHAYQFARKSKLGDQILSLSICKKIKDKGPDFTLINLQENQRWGTIFTLIHLQDNQRWGTRFYAYQFAKKKSKMRDQILRLSICKTIKDGGPNFTLINLQENQRLLTRFYAYQFARKSKTTDQILRLSICKK